MSGINSKKARSQNVFYHKDGLIDIFVGIGIFFGGLFLLSDLVWMVAIFVPVFMTSFRTTRNQILKSRLSKIDLYSNQQTRDYIIMYSITLLLGILLFAGLVVLFALDLTSGAFNKFFRHYIMLILGVIFSCVWFFVGMKLNIKRFFLYSILSFAAMSAVQIAILPFWIGLVIQGAVITIVGLVLLIWFLHQHPIKNDSDLV